MTPSGGIHLPVQTANASGAFTNEVNRSLCARLQQVERIRCTFLGPRALVIYQKSLFFFLLFFFSTDFVTCTARRRNEQLPAVAVWPFNIYAGSARGLTLLISAADSTGQQGPFCALFAGAPSPPRQRSRPRPEALWRPVSDVIAGMMSSAGQVACAAAENDFPWQ